MNAVLLVIAGPNGAGKTTVTARLREERWSEGVEYLNPDEIARDRFGDWNSPDAVLRAAEWTKQRREELVARRAGVAFETVLSLTRRSTSWPGRRTRAISSACFSLRPPTRGSTLPALPIASSPGGMPFPLKRSSPGTSTPWGTWARRSLSLIASTSTITLWTLSKPVFALARHPVYAP